jgi:hypothetical protein
MDSTAIDNGTSVDELLAHVRARIAGEQQPASADGAGGPEGGIASQADINEAIVRALGQLARHQLEIEAKLAIVEEWLREETERGATTGQRLTQRIAAIAAEVEALRARFAGPNGHANESTSGHARQPLLALGWHLLARGRAPVRNGQSS